MRARIKFTIDLVQDSLVGVLKDHHWWPQFDQLSENAQQLIKVVRDSVDENDIRYFDESHKIVVTHTPTEAIGTFSYEHGVWVVRLFNENMHLLQRACETLVLQMVEYVNRNSKKISFLGPIQIVERKRKETIIEGVTLATPEERIDYVRSHKSVEFLISRVGLISLVLLLFMTFPWAFRNFNDLPQNWIFSIFEKFIGSIAVTTAISYLQYRSFLTQLRDYSIRWSIPGAPEQHDINTRARAI